VDEDGTVSDKAWKQFERRVSRDHGVERQPITGERDGSDSQEHPVFVFQMKLRKAIPKCIREWSDSIHRAAQRAEKIGILIVKEPGKHDDNALVIVRYRDWVELHGSTQEKECPDCFGAGDVEAQDRPSEDGGALYVDCERCSGTGRLRDALKETA
jgi:NAD-dependent SIR2 family protein deacetylase